MKTKPLIAVFALVAAFVILILAVWYLQTNVSTPSVTPTPSPSPYLPPANVTANISLTPIRNYNDTSFPEGDYLLINGNVTNDSPNIAYNVGLHVGASAFVIHLFNL